MYANFVNPFRPGDAMTSVTYIHRVEQHPNGERDCSSCVRAQTGARRRALLGDTPLLVCGSQYVAVTYRETCFALLHPFPLATWADGSGGRHGACAKNGFWNLVMCAARSFVFWAYSVETLCLSRWVH